MWGGNCTAQGPCWYTEICPTLKSAGPHAVMHYETDEHDSCDAENQGGCDIDSHGKRAGKGALIQWERSGTLGVTQDQTLIVIDDERQESADSE